MMYINVYGEIELGARIKSAQIGPNQSTNTTTCVVNVFTSLEDLFKPFRTLPLIMEAYMNFLSNFLPINVRNAKKISRNSSVTCITLNKINCNLQSLP